MKDFYKKELQRLEKASHINVKFQSDDSTHHTKWMGLNKISVDIIIEYLQKLRPTLDNG